MQEPSILLTYPGEQTHLELSQVLIQPSTSNLLQLLSHALFANGEYTSLAFAHKFAEEEKKIL